MYEILHYQRLTTVPFHVFPLKLDCLIIFFSYRAKRDGIMNKKKAERAAKRNDIRAKYGLKESRNDVQMVEDHGPAGKSTGEEDSKCLVM